MTSAGVRRREIIPLFGIVCWLGVIATVDGAIPEAGGTIEGTVVYRADAARPWRYGRYYIKDPQTGELAESVVALRSRAPGSARLPPSSKSVTIDQKNYQFQPEIVAIRAGDSVTFTNSDDSIHNVRSSSRIASFNVTIPPGGSHTIRFEKAGGVRTPVQIGCVFHSAMQAWVFVFDHPHFQITGADGRFRLEDVPPGQYELEMAHPAGELRWRRRVEVRAGETLQIDIVVSPDDKE